MNPFLCHAMGAQDDGLETLLKLIIEALEWEEN